LLLRESRVAIIVIIIIVYSLCDRRLVAPVVYLSVKTIRCGGLLAGTQLFPYGGVILGLVPLEWGGLMFLFLVEYVCIFQGYDIIWVIKSEVLGEACSKDGEQGFGEEI
jgi:hypothetical protein